MVTIGDKFIVPSNTQLWFIDLQESFITTRKYIIEVTNLTYGESFFGDLYEITFEGGAFPGLRKLSHGQTSANLSMVEPLGNILEPNPLFFRNYYNLNE